MKKYLSEEESALHAIVCDPLLVSCYLFDVAYDYIDDGTKWKSIKASHNRLLEEIKESTYTESEKKVMVSSLLSYAGKGALPVTFPVIDKHNLKRAAKGFLGWAEHGHNGRELREVAALHKLLIDFSKVTKDKYGDAYVYSPAFKGNPGNYKNKIAMTDYHHTMLREIVNSYGLEHFRLLESFLSLFEIEDLPYTTNRVYSSYRLCDDEFNSDKYLYRVDDITFDVFETRTRKPPQREIERLNDKQFSFPE